MTPDAARTAALRAFGSTVVIEEQCRDTRRVAFVEHIVQDLRYTLRSLVRQPMLLAAAVLSIGVAIGANTTIFNLASQLLFAVPSATSPERLVHIWVGGGSNVSHRQWRALEESRALEGLTGFNIETTANWRGPDQTIESRHDGGRRQLLRRRRRADGARPRVHRPRGAGGARPGGCRHQPPVLAEAPGWQPVGHRQHADIQRPGLHGDRCHRGGRAIDRRVRSCA